MVKQVICTPIVTHPPLPQALAEAHAASAAWEARAEAGLAHSERLKDLLAESAAWPSADEDGGGGGGASAPGGKAVGGASGGSDSRGGGGGGRLTEGDAADVRRALLAEQARTAELQVQVTHLYT